MGGKVKVGLALSPEVDRFFEVVAAHAGLRKSAVVEEAARALARCPPEELAAAVERAKDVLVPAVRG